MPRVLAVLVSAAAAAGVWLTWRVFVGTGSGQAVEAAALSGARFGQTRLWQVAEPILAVVSMSFVVGGAAVAVVIALLRRRWALAVQAIILVAGANLATQVLKYRYFDRPELGGDLGSNTLPSGHTTVAASFAAALVLVAPRRGRPVLAVLGATYTAATGISTLIGRWHRPSDAIAAVLVVLAVAALVCAFGPPSEADRALPRTGDDGGGTAVAAALLVFGAVGAALPALWGLREAYQNATAGNDMRTVATYVAGAFGVASMSAVVFVLLLLVRQSTARPRNE